MTSATVKPFSLTAIKRFWVLQRTDSEVIAIAQTLTPNEHTINTVATYIHEIISTDAPEHAITRSKALENAMIEDDVQRLLLAKEILWLETLSAEQEEAILHAHHKIHWEIPFYLLTPQQREEKKQHLTWAWWFSSEQADQLIYNIVCAKLTWVLLIALAGALGFLTYVQTDEFKHREKMKDLIPQGLFDKKEKKKPNPNPDDTDENDLVVDPNDPNADELVMPDVDLPLDTVLDVKSWTLAKFPGANIIALNKLFNLHEVENLPGTPFEKPYTVPENLGSGITSVTLLDEFSIANMKFGFKRDGFKSNLTFKKADQLEKNPNDGTQRILTRKLEFKFTQPLSIVHYNHPQVSTTEVLSKRKESTRKQIKKIASYNYLGQDIPWELKFAYEDMNATRPQRVLQTGYNYLWTVHEQVAIDVILNMWALFVENKQITDGETDSEMIVEFGLVTGEYYKCRMKSWRTEPKLELMSWDNQDSQPVDGPTNNSNFKHGKITIKKPN